MNFILTGWNGYVGGTTMSFTASTDRARKTRTTYDLKSAALVGRAVWPVKRAHQMEGRLVHELDRDLARLVVLAI